MNKKLLLSISALLIAGLVACGNNNSSSEKTPTSSQTPVSSEASSEKPSSQTPVSSENSSEKPSSQTPVSSENSSEKPSSQNPVSSENSGNSNDSADTPLAEGVSIIADGKLVTFTSNTPSDPNNKYELVADLEKDALVYFYENANALVVGNENAESYTAPKSGNYIIYINSENKVYPVLNSVTACEAYAIEVNGTVDSEVSVTPDAGNYAQFVVTLSVDDVVTIKGDSDELYTYTCTVEGEHTFYVNNKHEVTTKAPTAANVIRVEFIVPDWATSAPRIHYWGSTNTESLDLFKVGAQSNMTQVDDGYVYYIELDPAETYDGCIIIFDQNSALKQSGDLDLSTMTLTPGKAYTITMGDWYDRGDGVWFFRISIAEKI